MLTLFGFTERFSGVAKPPYATFSTQIHPEDRELADKKVWEAVKTGSEFESEFRIIWPDKTTHFISARGKSYQNAGGKSVRMTGLCWDITQRKCEELAR